MCIKNNIVKLLEKGTENCESSKDVRLVRTLNFLFYAFLFFMFPVVVIYNIFVKDYQELLILVVIYAITYWSLKLNQSGKSQKAVTLSSVFGITVVYPVVYLNDVHMGAPFSALLMAFLAIVFIKNKIWKNTVFIYGFITFVSTNMFQLMHRPFSMVEHIVSLIFILLIFLIFKYISNLQKSYEEQLQQQNEIIQEQSDKLLKIQKEQHEQEIKLRQKDLEKVIATNATQIQIKENLIERLKGIPNGTDSKKEIRRIILELKQQLDSQKKIELLQENIEDVNALFLDKLYNVAPNISKSEEEICMYLMLGLSTKEIATLKNTTGNTINVTKTRLRNKLGLNKNAEILTFLRAL